VPDADRLGDEYHDERIEANEKKACARNEDLGIAALLAQRDEGYAPLPGKSRRTRGRDADVIAQLSLKHRVRGVRGAMRHAGS